MLVFLSDVHLTDGSSGETIKPTAFGIFSDNLVKLAETVSPLEELRVVLLGDIFDVIRSSLWLATPIRPWDPQSPEQQKVVEGILQAILSNNLQSLASFDKLRQFAGQKGITFEINYVIGNHDWLINRYPSCREQVAKALGVAPVSPAMLPTEFFDPDYRVIARHGDILDKFNYMGDRNASSIGDAIVIELLNKYPHAVEVRLNALMAGGDISMDEKDSITSMLKELDNIRPVLDAASWVLMVSQKTANPLARKAIEDAWEACVDDFFKVPFIAKQDKFMWPDTIDLLQIALHLSSHTSKRVLETIAGLKEKLFPADNEASYRQSAFVEPKVRSGEASYVIYGHTHADQIVPMDQVPTPDGLAQNKIYFNTGTWRKTWNKVLFDPINREFIGWHVLSYVALFKPTENGSYNYEVWTGALG
jgi:UDP-2,3-diacylglucosamine pyrophosphatase LpxH